MGISVQSILRGYSDLQRVHWRIDKSQAYGFKITLNSDD